MFYRIYIKHYLELYMRQFEDESYLISPKFNEHTLCKGLINLVSRLEDYRVNPVSKQEIKYCITQILIETQILEEWCNAMHDNTLDDEMIEELNQRDIKRNIDFLAEGHKQIIVDFYNTQNSIADRIRQDCYR